MSGIPIRSRFDAIVTLPFALTHTRTSYAAETFPKTLVLDAARIATVYEDLLRTTAPLADKCPFAIDLS